MGTISYMSPEQARGAKTDSRTDIWSLGVVLYEMATSRRPFDGDTPSHTIVSILEKEPPALSKYNADTPPELEWIVTKAMAKDKDKRYQTAKDLLNDLRELKKRLEIEAEIARRAAPNESVTRNSTGEARRTAEPTFERESPTTDAMAAQPTSSAEYIVGEIKRYRVGAGLVASIALCIASLIYFGGVGEDQNINSLAVLPFVNAGADPDAEYFSDGVTESLTNSLSQLPNLKVMSRNSVFRYKGKEMDALAAGRDLGVRAVLTGRVAQRTDGLTVSVELVDARDNSQIWGRQYNRKFADVLAVQEEIARDISEKLRSKLTGEEQRRVTRRYTDNVEAYQLYLRGRYEWNKFTPEGVGKSIEFFNQAIAVDPTYAPAFAGISAAYNLQGHVTSSTAEVYRPAKWAAERAVALDDSLSEAHSTLASVKLFFEWDWAAAEREVRRAIELNPNSAEAHALLGSCLKTMRRMDEAKAEVKRAQELDPLSLFINAEIAQDFYFARRYWEAIAHSRKSLEIGQHPLLYHASGRALVQKGSHAEAVAEFEKAIGIFGRTPLLVASLGHAHAVAGNRVEAQKMIDELKETSKQRYVPSYWIAVVYAGLDDKEQAFAALDKAIDERFFLLIWLNIEPRFDNLRSEIRFAGLLRRMNL